MSLNLTDIGVQIATRELDANGRKVTVAIGKPEPYPDEKRVYYCPYQIVGIGDERVRCACGMDAVQALRLALMVIGAELDASPEAQEKRLSWLDQKDDFGFPLADAPRD